MPSASVRAAPCAAVRTTSSWTQWWCGFGCSSPTHTARAVGELVPERGLVDLMAGRASRTWYGSAAASIPRLRASLSALGLAAAAHAAARSRAARTARASHAAMLHHGRRGPARTSPPTCRGTGGVLRAHAARTSSSTRSRRTRRRATGDHVFVRIEKRGLTTPRRSQRIARALGVARARHRRRRHEGSPRGDAAVALAAAAGRARGRARARARRRRVLEAARHGHKLRTGHVRANRFVLRVRGSDADAVERARAILDALAQPPGAPNWYGEQRFGARRRQRGARPRDRARRPRAAARSASSRACSSRRCSPSCSTRGSPRGSPTASTRACSPATSCTSAAAACSTCERRRRRRGRASRAGELVVDRPDVRRRACAAAPTGTPAAAREDAILAAAGLAHDEFASVARDRRGHAPRRRRSRSARPRTASTLASRSRSRCPPARTPTAVMREVWTRLLAEPDPT